MLRYSMWEGLSQVNELETYIRNWNSLFKVAGQQTRPFLMSTERMMVSFSIGEPKSVHIHEQERALKEGVGCNEYRVD